MRLLTIITLTIVLGANVIAQVFPDNETGQYEDMLTPAYYTTPHDANFRDEVNKMVYHARQIPFQHPLEDNTGQRPSISIFRSFGDGIGFNNSSSHHAADDYYVGNKETNVALHAAHDGQISISRDVSRYRHYIAITSDISDTTGSILGKMMSLYGHVDLDLDTASGLAMDGKWVQKGDIISQHLYSGTMGGPHLHFEIRYYRHADSGAEDFYGGHVGDKTAPSAGSWEYGYWNPDSGYGFGDPDNHISNRPNGISENPQAIPNIYPNPTKGTVYISQTSGELTIHNLQGKEIYHQEHNKEAGIGLDLSDHPKGIYILSINNGEKQTSHKIIKE